MELLRESFTQSWRYMLGKNSFTQKSSLMKVKRRRAASNRMVPAWGFAHGPSLTLPHKSHVQETTLYLKMILWHDLAFSDLIRHLIGTYTRLVGEGSLPIQQPIYGLFVGRGPYLGLWPRLGWLRSCELLHPL